MGRPSTGDCGVFKPRSPADYAVAASHRLAAIRNGEELDTGEIVQPEEALAPPDPRNMEIADDPGLQREVIAAYLAVEGDPYWRQLGVQMLDLLPQQAPQGQHVRVPASQPRAREGRSRRVQGRRSSRAGPDDPDEPDDDVGRAGRARLGVSREGGVVGGFWKAPRELARMLAERELTVSAYALLHFLGESGADRPQGLATSNGFLAESLDLSDSTVRRGLSPWREKRPSASPDG